MNPCIAVMTCGATGIRKRGCHPRLHEKYHNAPGETMKISHDDLALIANTVRALSMDAVQKANSGHPGMPMGCADIAAVLWTKILRHNPSDPAWVNRDRFVLSAGHGSMLLYSMLHLTGYALTLDDIKNFRQVGSLTPGHPEFGHTPGVETTTGPLGQGFANAVGMALAARLLAREFPGLAHLLDHRVYAIVSDGDLMEGISAEAASLAGHWGLGNIVFIYDSNGISIEGDTMLAFSEDVAGRFIACGWHVQEIDGHNFDAIEKAVIAGREETSMPSLIIANTRIAKGSPGKEGSADSHGAPLGAEEVRKSKQNIGCSDGEFCVPARVYEIFSERKAVLGSEARGWAEKFDAALDGDTGRKWRAFFSVTDIKDLAAKLPAFKAGDKIATRTAGGKVLEALFRELPNIAGGSADLGPSNKSFVKGYGETGHRKIGRNIHFGIREHAMGAIQNGMAYYGGFIPYSATFFMFIDYMRPAVRLAALARLRAIYMFTHDSLFVGEDGPTHQPVEHLAAARAIPNLAVIRPADAEETREAWLAALARTTGPTALILTRQDIPVLERSGGTDAGGLHRGAYPVHDGGTDPGLVILASGSEVHISVEAARTLEKEGIRTRVVSFPCWELFDAQDPAYREKVLGPAGTRRAVVEAGLSLGWERYAGAEALFITMESFGESAPAGTLAVKYGFTAENIAARVRDFLGKK
jgi:transketolase